jgi:hypothetical protein
MAQHSKDFTVGVLLNYKKKAQANKIWLAFFHFRSLCGGILLTSYPQGG